MEKICREGQAVPYRRGVGGGKDDNFIVITLYMQLRSIDDTEQCLITLAEVCVPARWYAV